jgi:hypothetical protein
MRVISARPKWPAGTKRTYTERAASSRPAPGRSGVVVNAAVLFVFSSVLLPASVAGKAEPADNKPPHIRLRGAMVPCTLKVVEELPFRPVRMTCRKLFDQHVVVSGEAEWDLDGGYRCTSEPRSSGVLVTCQRDIYVR